MSVDGEQTGRNDEGARPMRLGTLLVWCVVFLLVACTLIVIAVGYLWTAAGLTTDVNGAQVQGQISYQTCRNCYSVREGQSGGWTVTYRGPQFARCQHNWEDGIPFGVEDAVCDGSIVLVHQQGQFGAFIPAAQTSNSMKYRWYYRPDGGGRLDPDDPVVQSGTGRIKVPSGTSGGSINFGPFSMFWSECGQGEGWIYYNAFVGGPANPEDIRICLTNETDITTIDASDRKWIYRAFPGDAGLPGGRELQTPKNQ